MKIKSLLVICCLVLLATAVVVLADDNAVEIQLFEVVNSGFIGGYDPLDSPVGQGDTPPRPNEEEFHAYILDNTLTVIVDNVNTTNIVVTDETGATILEQQFVGFTTEIISDAGSYAIEIENGGMTLLGQFNVQ